MASISISPMAVGGVQHLIERAYRESGDMQYVRELFVNAIEAGATRIEFGPEWRAVEKDGVYRLMVADNGKGMNKDELLKFLNTFGGGGKPIGDAHENYGVGAKTSLLPWNHAGVVVMSWVAGDPEGSMVWLARDPDSGEYGAVKIKTDDGGYHEVVVPTEEWAALKPAWLTTNGTIVVCLGNTKKEDTYRGKDGNGDIKGISAYLNKRVFEIPSGVDVFVQELRYEEKSKWPRSYAEATGPGAANKGDIDRRWNRRRVRGSLHFVAYKPEKGVEEEQAKGKMSAQGGLTLDDGTVIDWHLWEGERPAVHSYAHKNGFIAALYKNELYDTHVHPAQYRSFGITQRAVRENLTLIARPPVTDGKFGVYPDTARNALRIQGHKKAGEPLPWSEWGYEFAEKMPDAIRVALAKAGPSNSSGTVRDASWRERLIDRFGARWKSLRFLLGVAGPEKVKPIHGMGPTGGGGEGGAGNGGGGGNGPGPLGGTTTEPVFGAKRGGQNTAPATKTSSKGGIPDWEWSDGSEVDEGCAAAWVSSSATHANGVVLMNRAFPSFVEVKKFWRDQFPDHVGDLVDRTIEDVYGEAMVARIAHSEEFVRDAAWGQARVDKELRSGAALTMAALGLISEDQVIGSRLSGVVGAKKKA